MLGRVVGEAAGQDTAFKSPQRKEWGRDFKIKESKASTAGRLLGGTWTEAKAIGGKPGRVSIAAPNQPFGVMQGIPLGARAEGKTIAVPLAFWFFGML